MLPLISLLGRPWISPSWRQLIKPGLIVAVSLFVITTLSARESYEDNRNVVVNDKGDVILVMLCDRDVPEKCFLVNPASGDPRYVGIRENDDRYLLVRYDNGNAVARIVRASTTVWVVLK